MNILQVAEPGMDGVFRHLEGLILDLLTQGHRVSLAYSSVRGSDRLQALSARVVASGGSVLDLRVSNAPDWPDISAQYRLYRLVLRERPDIIHTHSSKAGALGRMLRLFGIRTPIFYTPNAYYGLGKAGLKPAVFNAAESLLGNIGITINVSRDEAEFARQTLHLPPWRQRVVPNGVDTEVFRPPSVANKAALRAEHGIPENATVLGTVGRFSDQKDYPTFYRALIPILKEHPNLYVLHVGRGDPDEKLHAEIQAAAIAPQIKRILYLADTRYAYQMMDGFALTSRYEGLSYAILEALASDLPLMLSDVPGNREFLRLSLSHCWSAPGGNIPAHSRSISQWLQDRTVIRPSNHRNTAIQLFSLPHCHRLIVRAYEEALSLYPGPGAFAGPDPHQRVH